MKNLFQKPKELVMSVITLMVAATFCYLSIVGKVSAQALKEVLMFVLGGYFGVKAALSGNGTKTQEVS